MEAVAEFDILGNGDSILGDFWSAEGSINDYIAATGTKSDLDCVCEHITALKHKLTGFSSELDDFSTEVNMLCGHKLMRLDTAYFSGKVASDKILHSFISLK
jgi:hypothetical protein